MIDRKKLREKFSTHRATLIQDTDRYFAVDWRREDGSGDYYVNYILDKQRGNLIVSGDLGDCIATWYNPTTPSKIKEYIHNDIGYYIGKFQATSNKYIYDESDVLSDIKERIGEDVTNYYDEHDEEEEFWGDIKDELYECVNGDTFTPSDELYDMISGFDEDCSEWLYYCGRRINLRCYLWAEGFYMACEQLGI